MTMFLRFTIEPYRSSDGTEQQVVRVIGPDGRIASIEVDGNHETNEVTLTVRSDFFVATEIECDAGAFLSRQHAWRHKIIARPFPGLIEMEKRSAAKAAANDTKDTYFAVG